ncbi:MAG: hypothetical protein JW759_00185 [Candidatus Coatesbacteria bacterium]|nr:hypothetical protein [Candidatus Coatesbacteria bacterium]
MFLGYDFKDPIKWAAARMASEKSYRAEIRVSFVVGIITIAAVFYGALAGGYSMPSAILAIGFSAVVLDAVILRGIMYSMALRRFVLERQEDEEQDLSSSGDGPEAEDGKSA